MLSCDLIEYLDAFQSSIWTRFCAADASKRLICDAECCFVAILYRVIVAKIANLIKTDAITRDFGCAI